MRTFPILLIIAISASGCATLFNSKKQHIKIIAGDEINKIYVDTQRARALDSITYLVKRGKQPIKLTIYTDSGIFLDSINAKNSTMFWLNIFNDGIGFIPDWKNPKRYGFRKYNTVEYANNKIKIHKYNSFTYGDIRFNLSFPFINSIYTNQTDTTKGKQTGCWGIEGGLDYFINRNNYLSCNMGSASTLFLGLPHALHGEFSEYFTNYFQLKYMHRLQNTEIGIGVHLANNVYQMDNTGPSNKLYPYRINKGFGPNLSIQKKITGRFYLGALYQPNLFRMERNTTFEYGHFLSFYFGWHFPTGFNLPYF
ncbi:MAG: hypothetical protein KG003_10375 [Bacteroidetes bacterium]|nr:hypothetical protein [Bacteroidota bacterium]